MSSNNGSFLPTQSVSPDGTRLASESFVPEPGLNGNGHCSQASVEAPVLDGTLDEADIKIAISFDLHSRTTRFTTLRVERTVADALDVTNHWMLLRGLREALEDVGKGVRHRIKGKLGSTPTEGKEQDEALAGDCAAEKIPDEMIIHIPPPITGFDSKF